MRSLLLFAATLLASATFAFAHDPGLSSAAITVGHQSIDAVITFNQRDWESLGGKPDDLAKALLKFQVADEPLPLRSHTVERDSAHNVEFRLRFAATSARRLHIESGVMNRLPFGHRQMLSVRTANGENVVERLIGARENGVDVDLAPVWLRPPASDSRFAEFFLLGVKHILSGYDHLLFLAGILIVCSSFGAAARIITCFTTAHTITLGLATFNMVTIPSRLVEPLIAASIVYVGFENLWSGEKLRRREALTFAFGLVHGLGFASVLREMGIGARSAGVAIPLFSFNFGVEAGQLLVAACVLPIALKYKSAERLPRLAVPVMSCLIAFAGLYWLVERIAA